MFRKWICLTTASATLFAMAFCGFDREAQAGARRRAGSSSYFNGYGMSRDGYSNSGIVGIAPPNSAASPQAAAPQANYWPYTPGYDKYARQRYGWQLPPRRAVVQIDGAVPRDAASRVPPRSLPDSQRHRRGTVGGRLSTPDNLDSPAFGSEARRARDAAAAAQSAAQDHPGAISPSPGTGPAGATGFPANEAGSLRGAGAPSNDVNSRTEGANTFRDEADAQSTKLPPVPGNANPNR